MNTIKHVRTSIIRALTKGKSKGRKPGPSFLIDRLVVDISTKYQREELWIDYENSKIVLEVPKLFGDTKEAIRLKKESYYSNMLRSVEALATIGITHIYLVLDEKGREQLEAQKGSRTSRKLRKSNKKS